MFYSTVNILYETCTQMVTLQKILNAAMQWLLPWAFTCAGACSQSGVSSSRTESLGYQRCSGIRETPYPTVQLGGSDHLPAPNPSIKLGWKPLVFCCFLISSCRNVSVLFKEGLKTQLFVDLSLCPACYRSCEGISAFSQKCEHCAFYSWAGSSLVAVALRTNISPPLLACITIPIVF